MNSHHTSDESSATGKRFEAVATLRSWTEIRSGGKVFERKVTGSDLVAADQSQRSE